MRTTHRGRTNVTCVNRWVFRRARRRDAELRERDFVAEKNERRRFVVVERAEAAIRSGKIGVEISVAGREQIRDLALGAECGGAAGFRHHQRCGPGQTIDWLAEL